ncbi:MAG: dockerin type I repeat-containing protein [Clostridia bacterium]|nr:dockerin type I repeat-containing protein [Clostridia bacterium]
MKKTLALLLVALLLLVSSAVSAKEAPVLPTDGPVHLEGYSIGDQSGDTLSKWIGFYDDDPSVVETYTFQLTTYAAAYHDGRVYGYVYGYDADGVLDCDFYVMDASTHIVSYPGGSSGGEFVYAMAYDPTDGVMYALCDEEQPYIASVDLGTGELTREVNIQLGSYLGIYAFAIDGDGRFLALNMSAVSAKLLEINRTTGALTVIGDTGLQCYYAQSMTYDGSTGRLYWAESDADAHSCLYWLDPATGTATLCGQIGQSGIEVTCLYTVYDAEPSPVEPIPGDVDGSGDVSVTDAILALRCAMGLAGLDEQGLAAADIDGDGSVSVSDAITILRMAMGILNNG